MVKKKQKTKTSKSFGVFYKKFFWRFEPFEDTNSDGEEYVYACYDNTSIFIISMFQYITMAVIFSKGFPYRKSIFTNCNLTWIWNACIYDKIEYSLIFMQDIFLFFLALCFVLCVLLTFIDAEPLMDFFEVNIFT